MQFLILALSVVAFVACVKPTPRTTRDDKTPAYAIPEFELISKTEMPNYHYKERCHSLDLLPPAVQARESQLIIRLFALAYFGIKKTCHRRHNKLTIDDGDYAAIWRREHFFLCACHSCQPPQRQADMSFMTTPESNPKTRGPIRAVSMLKKLSSSQSKCCNITITD